MSPSRGAQDSAWVRCDSPGGNGSDTDGQDNDGEGKDGGGGDEGIFA